MGTVLLSPAAVSIPVSVRHAFVPFGSSAFRVGCAVSPGKYGFSRKSEFPKSALRRKRSWVRLPPGPYGNVKSCFVVRRAGHFVVTAESIGHPAKSIVPDQYARRDCPAKVSPTPCLSTCPVEAQIPTTNWSLLPGPARLERENAACVSSMVRCPCRHHTLTPRFDHGTRVVGGGGIRRSCTRRFCARPASVLLENTGRSGPNPCAVRMLRSTPLLTR